MSVDAAGVTHEGTASLHRLSDAQTSEHLWAARYDRLLDDIFAVQDEITMSVIGAIEPNLRKVEIDRVKRTRPDNLDAYDLVLRALPFVRTGMVQGANAAIPLLKRALEIEPEYAWARALLAQCFHFRFSRGGILAKQIALRQLSMHALLQRRARTTPQRSQSRRWLSGSTVTMSPLPLSSLIVRWPSATRTSSR